MVLQPNSARIRFHTVVASPLHRGASSNEKRKEKGIAVVNAIYLIQIPRLLPVRMNILAEGSEYILPDISKKRNFVEFVGIIHRIGL